MILVTGAMGFVGRHLVQALIEQELPVRVLLPQRWHRRAPWDVEKVDMVAGSIFEPEVLFRAMGGVHTVFHLASAQWWGNLFDLENVDLNGTANVIAAGRSARIGRLIVLSHLGAEPSSGFNMLRISGQKEDLVRRSGLAYTVLRTGVIFGAEDHFVNNIAMRLRSNPIFTFQPGEGEALLNPIHIDDLTEALVKSLDILDLIDDTVSIGGPEYISFNEMLRTIMRVSRCSRVIVAVPPYLLRGIALLSRVIPTRWVVTPQWFDMLAGNRTADLSNLFQYTGIRPRRFEDTLVTYMPKRRYSLELIRYLFRRRKRSAY